MAAVSKLVAFVRKAKAMGYEDYDIRKALLKYGWVKKDINEAFVLVRGEKEHKNIVHIHLNDDILKKLEKRADKNMLNLHEQIEDILRRSVLNLKKNSAEEKVDDKFITFFSRKKR